MGKIYDPQLPDGVNVVDLTPATPAQEALTPETIVVVINRGHETLVRKFDGIDYPLHPHTVGLIKMPYGAALHFQKHCTVPGTRDAVTSAEQSYLGILGIDPEDWCTPFSVAECEAFGQRVEAIQREEGEEVTAVNVGRQVASGKVPVGRGQSRGGKKTGFARKGVTAKGDEVDRAEVMTTDGRAAQDVINDVNNDE